MSEMELGVLFIYGTIYLIMFAIIIAVYVFNSLALQTIAKRRQIQKPWLAWIPIGTEWILGSIADEYESHQGKKTKWRKKLVGFSIGMYVSYFVMYAVLVVGVILMSLNLHNIDGASSVTFIIAILFGYFLFLAVSITYTVFYYICLYKLFKSTDPKNAVIYLVLCILVPFAHPICLTICKNKGYSIPPQPNYTQQNPNYNQPTYY